MLVHHGGIYTPKYLRQTTVELPAQQAVFFHSLEISVKRFAVIAGFLEKIALAIAKKTQKRLREEAQAGKITLTELGRKAVDMMLESEGWHVYSNEPKGSKNLSENMTFRIWLPSIHLFRQTDSRASVASMWIQRDTPSASNTWNQEQRPPWIGNCTKVSDLTGGCRLRLVNQDKQKDQLPHRRTTERADCAAGDSYSSEATNNAVALWQYSDGTGKFH